MSRTSLSHAFCWFVQLKLQKEQVFGEIWRKHWWDRCKDGCSMWRSWSAILQAPELGEAGGGMDMGCPIGHKALRGGWMLQQNCRKGLKLFIIWNFGLSSWWSSMHEPWFSIESGMGSVWLRLCCLYVTAWTSHSKLCTSAHSWTRVNESTFKGCKMMSRWNLSSAIAYQLDWISMKKASKSDVYRPHSPIL